MNRAATALLLSLSLLPALVGCGKDSPAKPVVVVPRDMSPAGIVRMYEHGMNNRNAATLDSLFTEDFRFYFATGDSTAMTADSIWLQPDEAVTNYAMLHGTPTVTPLQRVMLRFDKNLLAFPDDRPGRNVRFHKTIRTTLDFKAEVGDGSTYEIVGFLNFYLVRGDSAQILPGHGAPDSTRWWIQRIDDETLQRGIFRSMPAKSTTLGCVVNLGRQPQV